MGTDAGLRIVLNWPAGGSISFGAYGFTQSLRATPVLTESQRLTRSRRREGPAP